MPGDLREYETHAKTVSFARKLYWSRCEIERAAQPHNRWLVSSSWGKDSCALAGLVSETLGPGFHVSHLRSPYELPGCERVVEWFGARCVIHAVETSRTLAEYVAWLQQHGLGFEREQRRKVGRARKADELATWASDNGYTMQMLGMRADESQVRRRVFRSKGVTYQRSAGGWISNPIAWWSVTDVWAYLVSRNVPWHPLYDCETHGVTRKQIRNAGWLTVQGDATDWRIPWLRRHYPDQYRMLVEAFPQVRLLG